MLRKDKMALESLSKKYGKNTLLNEVSYELNKRALNKAKESGRWEQARTFAEYYNDKLLKDINNLKFEVIYSDKEKGNEEYLVVYICNGNLPMVLCNYFYKDGPTNNNHLGIVLPDVRDFDFNEKELQLLKNVFNKETKNNITLEDIYFADVSFIEDILLCSIVKDKKEARQLANVAKKINKVLKVDHFYTDWHDYYWYGYREDYGFTSDGKYIRESLKESRQPSINSQNNRDIKVVVMPIDVLPFFDERLDNLSDDEILEYALNLRHAKIYSAADFNHLWNNDQLDYSPRNSYMRIIRQTK